MKFSAELMKICDFKAFTLAEVMIVLTVIGVLTAILLPVARQSMPDEDLMKVCVKCREYDNCERRGCIIRHTQDALKSCIDCYFFKKDLHSCRPKPHYLTFNEKWEAECPHCKENNMRGVVRPVVAKTFATYIKNAWDFSYDQSLFVNDLLNEFIIN